MTASMRIATSAQEAWPRYTLGPPVRTLRQPEFAAACAELMRLVEADYAPTLIVGVRTGGLVVAEAMAQTASTPLPLLPLTCQRINTQTKSRLKLLRKVLPALPPTVTDLLRRLEHRLITERRAQQTQEQRIDRAEAEAIASWVAKASAPVRLLVADDAVDSGVTLALVLQTLRETCPSGTEMRSAAITQTLEHPIVRPDYVLHRGTLCRFPWSFDAAS